MWQPLDGNVGQAARDAETGALMTLHGTPEIDVTRVRVRLPRIFVAPFLGHREFNFFVREKPDKNGNLQLRVDSFQSLVRERRGSFADNTGFVRYLIEGLAAINRKWPLGKNPKFYSNLSDYKRRNVSVPEFDFPSDEELARL